MCEEIGEIARSNWNNRWTFEDLAGEQGLESAWHAGQQIGRAWRYFKSRGDSYTCAAISRVFWSCSGQSRDVNKFPSWTKCLRRNENNFGKNTKSVLGMCVAGNMTWPH